MTSKLKCPVCPYCDKLLHCDGTQYINERIVEMWYCQNPECEETEDLIGTREMWEIVANKIQAKQDLEIAREALRVVTNQYRLVKPRGFSPRGDMATLCAMGEFAEKALERIEHKEI